MFDRILNTSVLSPVRFHGINFSELLIWAKHLTSNINLSSPILIQFNLSIIENSLKSFLKKKILTYGKILRMGRCTDFTFSKNFNPIVVIDQIKQILQRSQVEQPLSRFWEPHKYTEPIVIHSFLDITGSILHKLF